MFGKRLSARLGTDHNPAVKDTLSGKERILQLLGVRGYPFQSLSACHFAALSFVRVVFKHVQRGRGGSSTSMARWLSAVTDRHVLEDMLSPCNQLTDQQAQLVEMSRVPEFKGKLWHVGTKLGFPSMLFFKQALRQMQLGSSPISAMVVSRNTSATACIKVRENSKDVFLVLEFSLAQPEHGDTRDRTLALVINTSLEQTAARLSGNLPLDNHLVTRDRQWQAQLSTNCTICTFTPVEGVRSSEAESAAINESIAMLRVLGQIDDRGQDLETRDEHGNRNRRQGGQTSGTNQGEVWERTAFEVDSATTATRYTIRISNESLGEGPSVRRATIRPKPYEQDKRQCRTFFSDDDGDEWSSSPILIQSPTSSRASKEDACFECVICLEDIPEEKGIHLVPCAHGFCRDCLAGHVSSKIEERKFPIFCPLCMIEQENANPSVVAGGTIHRLGISEAQYMIWAELEMAHLWVRVHCRRCDRSMLVDKEKYDQKEEVICPFHGCGHIWCKTCQQSIGIRSKHSCDGTKELECLVRLMGWKYCPKCRTPVQKSGGCNHMTCVSPGCNTHFCYRCGKQITRGYIPFLVRSAVNAHFKKCML